MSNEIYRYKVSYYARRYATLALFEAIMLAFIVVSARRGDHTGVYFSMLLAAGWGGAWLTLLQLTLSTIVASETGIASRIFSVAWRNYGWAGVSEIKRVRYRKRDAGPNSELDHVQYFVLTGHERRFFPFPISFFAPIENLDRLLDLINRQQAKYRFRLTSVDLPAGQPWNAEPGISVSDLR
jgi:hypothetical protein